MKTNIINFVIALLFITGCDQSEEKSITVTNTLSIDRPSELVVISRSIIEKLPQNKLARGIPVLYTNEMKILPSQLEDLDGDGQWDNLIFTADFKSNQAKDYFVFLEHAKKVTLFPKVTAVHFGVGDKKEEAISVDNYERTGDPRTLENAPFFQMEGPAWENDKIGFRIYFDPRNGIDIFGKTTNELVLSAVGIGEKSDYHSLDSWGMDVLKVGNSLGAGSIALLRNDSLFRVKGHKKARYQLIEEGPIKATFNLSYEDELKNDNVIQINHKISIYKGQWYYKSEVSAREVESGTALVTGIVNLKQNQQWVQQNDQYFSMSSYGKQSENNDKLGMSVLLKNDDYIHHASTSGVPGDVDNSYFVSMKIRSNLPTTYYFMAGWELADPKFNNQQDFQSAVSELADRLATPLEIMTKRQ